MRAIVFALALGATLGGCGGSGPTHSGSGTGPEGTEGSTRPSTGTSTGAALYDLHEWGVLALGASGFEVAAGAGQRNPMPIAVDKPVLYVHPRDAQPFDLQIRVVTPEGLGIPEHWPPTDLSPLRWRARVGGQCRGEYPQMNDSRCPNGYCEVSELGTYEADGAACLTVGDTRAPLLFYRLWAQDAPSPLPLEISRQGDAVIVRNRSLASPVGSLWRIGFASGTTRAQRADIPAQGGQVSIPPPTADAAAARADMSRMLREQGLTESEARAFERGWTRALFGAALADGDPGDDMPVDRLSTDETDLPVDPNAPRDPDVVIYWLPQEQVDAYARIEAEPAPGALVRVFLVRQIIVPR